MPAVQVPDSPIGAVHAERPPPASALPLTLTAPREPVRRDLRRRHLSWVVIGVGAVAIGLAVLGLLTSLVLQPFQSADESQHAAYALAISHDHLPTLSTRIRPELPEMTGGRLYTANHPPLFYVLMAVPLRLGISVGTPIAGFHLARLLNVMITVAGLVALAALIRVLAPNKPMLWVAAPALVGTLPLTVGIAGQIYNDALAVTTTTVTLLACCVVLIRGPSRRRIAFLAVSALLAAASRATGLEIAALSVISAVAASLLHRPEDAEPGARPAGRRLLHPALAVLLVPVVGIGWFYLRNQLLYGDITGSNVVTRWFPSPAVPVTTTSTSGRFWLGQFKGLFGRSALLTGWPLRLAVIAGSLMGVLLLVGVARAAWGLVKHRFAGPQIAVVVLLAAHAAASVVGLLVYVSHGGDAYPRYALAALPALAVAMAYGLAAIPPAKAAFSVAIVSVVSLLCSVVAIAMLARELHFKRPALGGSSTVSWLSAGLRTTGVPRVVGLWLPLFVVAAALIVTAVSLLRLRNGRRYVALPPVRNQNKCRRPRPCG